MKKGALILGFLLFAFGASAQEQNNVKRSDLKGPAYKNYKHGNHRTVLTTIYVVNEKKLLKGPAYKNYRPGQKSSKGEAIIINTNGHERQKLTGPAYKNYKPSKKKDK
ncbi:hypothetical protein [Algibacter aquimarinus]|uniref:Uncharacterized protein n=1 Tax=Algibacter aquimarinus TaxID=1136748 RepID=A0ABP9H570_9FLAO